jgi:hypothetical protein
LTSCLGPSQTANQRHNRARANKRRSGFTSTLQHANATTRSTGSLLIPGLLKYFLEGVLRAGSTKQTAKGERCSHLATGREEQRHRSRYGAKATATGNHSLTKEPATAHIWLPPEGALISALHHGFAGFGGNAGVFQTLADHAWQVHGKTGTKLADYLRSCAARGYTVGSSQAFNIAPG